VRPGAHVRHDQIAAASTIVTEPSHIDALLDEIVTLPSMPDVLANLTELLKDPDVTVAEVSRVIAMDPSIALKTLRLVNSAFYGLRETVSSIDHAVALLGMKVIHNMVYTATVFEVFRKDAAALLRHSIATGLAMKALFDADALSPLSGEEDPFVYGLLHDIGKFILEEYLPDESQQIVALSRAKNMPLWQAERGTLGADHADVGAKLARRWKLSDQLAGAIAGHHDIQRCPGQELRSIAGAMAIADFISNESGIRSHPDTSYDIAEVMWNVSGLAAGALPTALGLYFDSLGDIDELVKIAG
jgi:putative nucleotidyltransferase with HDIG domain